MTSPTCWRHNRRRPGEPVIPGTCLSLMLAMLFSIPGATAHETQEEGGVTLLQHARAAQHSHDFTRALALTKDALAVAPDDDRARLLQASLNLIRGETDAARQSCRQLRRSPPLVVVTCHANVARATGNVAGVRQKLDGMIAISDVSRVEPDLLAWSLSVAGDLAVAGREPGRALDYFRRSLDTVDNPQVRASLVDVLIGEGRLTDALDALRAGSPSLTLEVQHLIVLQDLGNDVSQQAATLDRRFRHWIRHQDYEHAREMARFYLDVTGEPGLADELARINAQLQHEPEDRLLADRAARAAAAMP